jgi:hypothetical protein
VKGCVTCQQNKNLTHRTHIPLYKIGVPSNSLPFTQVALDLITGIPKSRGHNSILTIIDHGCLWAAVFLSCSSIIMGPQIAQLYYCHLYPWLGIGTDNPGVEKGYPYPNPEIPLPSMPGRGISGLGLWVPLVPSILCRVVRKPSILSQVHVGYWVS